jgi:hypothetical protein
MQLRIGSIVGPGRRLSLRRRRAPVVIVAIVIALTGAVTLAGVRFHRPATGRVQQARLADCENIGSDMCSQIWTGYVAGNQGFTQASAEFQVPALSCPSGLAVGLQPPTGVSVGGSTPPTPAPDAAIGPDTETDAWVGIAGQGSNGSNQIVQDGIDLYCTAGNATYYAWIGEGPFGEAIGDLPNPVNAGDDITATVFAVDGFGDYTLDIHDWTGNWDYSETHSGGPVSSELAAVAAESSSRGGTYFPSLQVSDAWINGEPIGQADPQTWVEDPGNYQGTPGELVPSPIDASGQNFAFTWNLP